MAAKVQTAAAQVAASSVQLTVAAFVSAGLALGVLTRAKWGPLLDPSFSPLHLPSSVAQAAPVYLAVDAGQVYVLWLLNRILVDVCNYRGADRQILVLIGTVCVDCVALLYLLVSHAPGFLIYPIPLGLFSLVLSYPHFAYLGQGVAAIALGYALLRAPDDLGGWLRPYAQVQIATGAALAAPPLAGAWAYSAAVGYVLLTVILFTASVRPTARLAARSKR